MALKRDLSDLPTPAKGHADACPPDARPRFTHLLVQEWADQEAENGPREHAIAGTRFRHSDAGGCARALAYAALHVPVSNPMDLAGTWVTSLGTLIHEHVQAAIERAFPDAVSIEVKVQLDDLDGSGHADARIELPDRVVAYELKTLGGFGYKMAVGDRGAPQGPKHAHRIQAGMNAVGMEADETVIGYLATEAISIQQAAKKGIDELTRFCAEWTFTRDELDPLVHAEVARINGILSLLDEGTLPARKYPDPELPTKAVITDPTTGQWQVVDDEGQILDAGTWWACAYCRYQDTCARTPAGRVSISDVAVTIGLSEVAA